MTAPARRTDLYRTSAALPGDLIARIDGVIERFDPRVRSNISRAGVMRYLLTRGLDAIDNDRPIEEQLPPDAVKRPPSPGPRPKDGTPLTVRIAKLLEARPGEVLRPCEVAKILGEDVDLVRNRLLRMAERYEVDKLGPGQYQARTPPQARGTSPAQPPAPGEGG